MAMTITTVIVEVSVARVDRWGLSGRRGGEFRLTLRRFDLLWSFLCIFCTTRPQQIEQMEFEPYIYTRAGI